MDIGRSGFASQACDREGRIELLTAVAGSNVVRCGMPIMTVHNLGALYWARPDEAPSSATTPAS
jgi:hypothetical protein